MRRLSLLPSRRITSEPAVRSLYARAALGWQAGIERIGYTEAYNNLARHALEAAPLDQAAQVLDAGAGTGALSTAFARNTPFHCSYDLLDLSPEMLAQATTAVSANTRQITGAIGTATLPHQSYDRVLCGHVIEHCADAQAALNWLFDHLKPGGQAIFAISKPHWCTALLRWKYGNAAFTPAVVDQMLTIAGFTNITILPHPSGPPSRLSCGYLATRAF
ncbi:MAG: hypothetical protein COB16_15435 [Rhodobacteraceae bacterium]|nr:MAG: hypothetical protein COB16_15435 [Paracoccaceae bacterium]